MADNKKTQVTCTRCPAGCLINVVQDTQGQIIDISGFTCARGKKYAISEVTNPVRTIAAVVNSSVALEPVSVKTAQPVPKAKMMQVIQDINNVKLDHAVQIGDVIIPNVCDTGVDVVATKAVN